MQEKEPIIDIKSQPTVKKHGYTEEENREIMHKQMSAMRKLKADFGLEGIQSGAGGAKDTQMHKVKSRCESWFPCGNLLLTEPENICQKSKADQESDVFAIRNKGQTSVVLT